MIPRAFGRGLERVRVSVPAQTWAGVSIFGHGQGGAGALPRGMACVAPVYRPRDAEHTVLHQVVAEHLEAFLDAVAEAGDEVGLPQFVERKFREFLRCGVFEHGLARFRCESCGREDLVPFSCYLQQETMKNSDGGPAVHGILPEIHSR